MRRTRFRGVPEATIDIRSAVAADLDFAEAELGRPGAYEGVSAQLPTTAHGRRCRSRPSSSQRPWPTRATSASPSATERSGGVSDGCWTGRWGIPTLDGLGPVGGDDHTEAEWIEVATLEQRLELTVRLVGSICAYRPRARRWALPRPSPPAGSGRQGWRRHARGVHRPGRVDLDHERRGPRAGEHSPGLAECAGDGLDVPEPQVAQRRIAVGQVVDVGGRPHDEDALVRARVGAHVAHHGGVGAQVRVGGEHGARLGVRRVEPQRHGDHGRRNHRRGAEGDRRQARGAATARRRRSPPGARAAVPTAGSSGCGSCRRRSRRASRRRARGRRAAATVASPSRPPGRALRGRVRRPRASATPRAAGRSASR